jgi:hypothetical protein
MTKTERLNVKLEKLQAKRASIEAEMRWRIKTIDAEINAVKISLYDESQKKPQT